MEIVGRDGELERLASTLAPARVVTLWGAAGMGKSTLLRALVERRAALAEAEGESPPLLVDLELATTEADVVNALARALGIAATKSAVQRALEGTAPALLAFDHAEQCLDALAGLLATLRLDVPVAVATRERLRTANELPFQVDGLSLSSAAALLLARVARVRPAAASERDASAFAEAIAARLDGCPLALELAAGRACALSLAELAARLPRDFGLLRSIERDAKARHRTLETSIRLSWDLLDDAERSAFAACGAFRSSFTIADLSAVLGADATLAVETLHAKSMLRIFDDAGPRVALLHALHEFAIRELEARGDRAPLHRHAAHVVARWRESVAIDGGRVTFVDRASSARTEPDAVAVIERTRAGAADAGPEAIRFLALAVGRLRVLDGRYREALDLLAPIDGSSNDDADVLVRWCRIDAARRIPGADVAADLAALDAGADPSLARALAALARSMMAIPHDPDGRITHSRDAARMFGALGLTASEAAARARLGDALRTRERWAEADAEFERAIAASATITDPTVLAQLRAMHAANVFDRGPVDDAARDLAGARDAAIAAGDRLLTAQLTLALGIVASERGDFEEAAGRIVTATEQLRRLGLGPWILANAIQYAGRLHLEQGEVQAALTSFTEALALGEASEPDPASFTRACRAVALARLGEHEPAAAELALARPRLTAYRPWAAPLFEELLAQARGEPAKLAPGRAAEMGDDRRFVARLFARARRPADADANDGDERLVVWTGGQGFARGSGACVDLESRRPLRALLFALAEQRLASPGVALAPDRLIAVAWPGERISPDAARNRLRVSIAKLRSLGLEGLLLTQGSGYLLDPRVRLVLQTPNARK